MSVATVYNYYDDEDNENANNDNNINNNNNNDDDVNYHNMIIMTVAVVSVLTLLMLRLMLRLILIITIIIKICFLNSYLKTQTSTSNPQSTKTLWKIIVKYWSNWTITDHVICWNATILGQTILNLWELSLKTIHHINKQRIIYSVAYLTDTEMKNMQKIKNEMK